MKILEIAEYLKSVNLQEELSKRIHLFHDLVGIPVTGVDAEGLLYKSLCAVGIRADWSAMSHNPEKDMAVEINEQMLNFSQKGCKENKTRINFSSYRTTSANTLEEKLSLIEKLDGSLDAMLVFGRFHSKENVLPDYYRVYLIDPEHLNPKKFKWKTDYDKVGTLKGWHTEKSEIGINLGIYQKMSGQLWCDISRQCLEKNPEIILELMEIRI